MQLNATVNDIAHQFGCSRLTIHYLMNRYNRSGYARARGKTWSRNCNDVMSVSVITLTHLRNRFKRKSLFLVFTGFML